MPAMSGHVLHWVTVACQPCQATCCTGWLYHASHARPPAALGDCSMSAMSGHMLHWVAVSSQPCQATCCTGWLYHASHARPPAALSDCIMPVMSGHLLHWVAVSSHVRPRAAMNNYLGSHSRPYTLYTTGQLH